jgi:hypothetical protein
MNPSLAPIPRGAGQFFLSLLTRRARGSTEPWLDKHLPPHGEFRRFCAEVAALLAQAGKS